MVETDVLRRWAKGVTSDSVSEDDGVEDAGDEDAERNALWAGEDEREKDAIVEMPAEDAEQFGEFLEAEEPEIFEAGMQYCQAVSEGEAEDIARAREGILEAEQMAEGYPEMNKKQRVILMFNIEELEREYGDDAPEVTLAKAVALSRKGERV